MSVIWTEEDVTTLRTASRPLYIRPRYIPMYIPYIRSVRPRTTRTFHLSWMNVMMSLFKMASARAMHSNNGVNAYCRKWAQREQCAQQEQCIARRSRLSESDPLFEDVSFNNGLSTYCRKKQKAKLCSLSPTVQRASSGSMPKE